MRQAACQRWIATYGTASTLPRRGKLGVSPSSHFSSRVKLASRQALLEPLDHLVQPLPARLSHERQFNWLRRGRAPLLAAQARWRPGTPGELPAAECLRAAFCNTHWPLLVEKVLVVSARLWRVRVDLGKPLFGLLTHMSIILKVHYTDANWAALP